MKILSKFIKIKKQRMNKIKIKINKLMILLNNMIKTSNKVLQLKMHNHSQKITINFKIKMNNNYINNNSDK